MSWLGDILKHLELSKKFTAGVFVSTLSLLVGPAFFPEKIAEAPEQWRWLVVGGCIFSGTLLLIWAVTPILRFFSRIPSDLRNNPRISVPTAKENGFLLFLGEKFPNDSADLDLLRHDSA
jgi:RsiW-degrading membrane proteinase PrsW (M82 family)